MTERDVVEHLAPAAVDARQVTLLAVAVLLFLGAAMGILAWVFFAIVPGNRIPEPARFPQPRLQAHPSTDLQHYLDKQRERTDPLPMGERRPFARCHPDRPRHGDHRATRLEGLRADRTATARLSASHGDQAMKCVAVIALLSVAWATSGLAATSSAQLERVKVDAKIDAALPLSLTFTDDAGSTRTLGDAIGGYAGIAGVCRLYLHESVRADPGLCGRRP